MCVGRGGCRLRKPELYRTDVALCSFLSASTAALSTVHPCSLPALCYRSMAPQSTPVCEIFTPRKNEAKLTTHHAVSETVQYRGRPAPGRNRRSHPRLHLHSFLYRRPCREASGYGLAAQMVVSNDREPRRISHCRSCDDRGDASLWRCAIGGQ